GLVGDDGPTHHGAFDLSYLRSVPGAIIMAPSNEEELRRMLYTAMEYTKGPSFIRYPRGCSPVAPIATPCNALHIGVPEIRSEGTECALIGIGDCALIAQEAAALLKEHTITPTIVDARFAKPLDRNAYRAVFSRHSHIITLENNSVRGGFGSGVLELAADLRLKNMPRFLTCGLPDRFIEHGDIKKLLASIQLDPAGIATRVREFIRG
ncbi:MAG: hypothetical protein JW768_01120, partial [Chitinispirillaceae bacterium]|nr:hypothetical protein [Chitinispirillaceae bacterium]